MKKNLLIGCMTVLCLSPALANTQTADVITPQVPTIQKEQTVQKPSADEIKNAFTAFIKKNTQLGDLFDLSQTTVTAEGDNFVLTLPATEKEISSDLEGQTAQSLSLPEKKITLTYAGEFNGHAQYRIESIFEMFQSLVKDIIPQSTLTTEQFTTEMLWVPYYNLITRNTQNIKNLKFNLPDVLDLTVGSVIGDTLARPLGANKMDKADLQDAKDITIASEGISLSIPSISFEDNILISDLSEGGNNIAATEKASFKLDIPTLIATSPDGLGHMGSLSFSTNAQYQGDTLHLEAKLNNITLNNMMIPLPPVFLPTEISLNTDIKNINQKALNLLLNADEIISQEQRQLEAQKLLSDALFQINRIEVKNTETGISVSGTVQNQTSPMGLPQQKALLTAVITNLDKISPEPKVDTVQCEQVKQQMATLSDKTIADQAIQNACTPRGGFLDMWRPYLDSTKRAVKPDGTTTDTLTIILEDNKLTINGKELQ